MPDSLAGCIAGRMRATNELVLRLAEVMPEDELNWQAASHAPSAAFHLWHVARWSDRNQAVVPAMSPTLCERLGERAEIWQEQGLADAWGLTPDQLGRDETGIGMSDEAAQGFRPPSKDALVDYLQTTLTELERAFDAIDDKTAAGECVEPSGRPGTVATAMLSHLTHVCRHLGMIEALRGLHGERGSATA
jgi:hypothetical protein